jgi:hypothetical protein
MGQFPLSDHFDGKRFRNPSGVRAKGLGAVFRWTLERKKTPWPKMVENPPYPLPQKPAAGQVSLTFINHASFLLQTGDFAILIDPLYSERASPFSFYGT